MNLPKQTVFMLDVDNTLLDNDALVADLRSFLNLELGSSLSRRYWEIEHSLRKLHGYVDYFGAMQLLHTESETNPHLSQLATFFLDYPFALQLFPGALALLQHLSLHGQTVIVSDGDIVFQPRKIQRSGLWRAVSGRVLVYQHKETMLGDIKQRFPAQHYVMVDDKLRILSAMKLAWGNLLTTVFVRQGHYGLDPAVQANYPAADLTIEHIGDLMQVDFSDRNVG
ncbi:FMN phosphatase YigB (HAD superfamily) [Oxalobacteraceae bacterium GrIS 2.11]